MKNSRKLILGTILIILMVSSGPAYAQENLSGSISIIGSNTVLPIIADAQSRWGELHPDVTFQTNGPGSGAGFDALLDGTADLAPMSRAPKTDELTEASNAGQNIQQLTIGRDALVVVLHPDNPVNSLTTEQVSSIFNGTFRDWSEVDSSADFSAMADTTIRVVERDQDSGTHDFFNEYFLDGTEVPSSEIGANYAQYAGTGDLFSDVGQNINAIGYGGLAYVDNTIKAVDINGVEANKENAADESYPVSRPLFLVWDENDETDNPLIKEFTDYIMGPEGQYIVDSVGYIAVATAATTLTPVAGQSETPVSVFPFLFGFAIVALINKLRY